MRHRQLAIALATAGIVTPQDFPPEIYPPGFTKRRDPLASGTDHYSFQEENQHVRVLRLKLKRNEATRLYDANAGLFVCLTNACRLRLEAPAGRIQRLDLARGDSRWTFYSGPQNSDQAIS